MNIYPNYETVPRCRCVWWDLRTLASFRDRVLVLHNCLAFKLSRIFVMQHVIDVPVPSLMGKLRSFSLG